MTLAIILSFFLPPLIGIGAGMVTRPRRGPPWYPVLGGAPVVAALAAWTLHRVGPGWPLTTAGDRLWLAVACAAAIGCGLARTGRWAALGERYVVGAVLPFVVVLSALPSAQGIGPAGLLLCLGLAGVAVIAAWDLCRPGQLVWLPAAKIVWALAGVSGVLAIGGFVAVGAGPFAFVAASIGMWVMASRGRGTLGYLIDSPSFRMGGLALLFAATALALVLDRSLWLALLLALGIIPLERLIRLGGIPARRTLVHAVAACLAAGSWAIAALGLALEQL